MVGSDEQENFEIWRSRLAETALFWTKLKYYSKVLTCMLFGKLTVTQRRKWYKTFEPGKYRGLKIPDIFLTFWEKIRISSNFSDISPIFLNFLTIPDFSDIPDKVDTLDLQKRV